MIKCCHSAASLKDCSDQEITSLPQCLKNKGKKGKKAMLIFKRGQRGGCTELIFFYESMSGTVAKWRVINDVYHYFNFQYDLL